MNCNQIELLFGTNPGKNGCIAIQLMILRCHFLIRLDIFTNNNIATTLLCQTARRSDTSCCFGMISGNHYNLNSCTAARSYSLQNIIAYRVFHTNQTKEGNILIWISLD